MGGRHWAGGRRGGFCHRDVPVPLYLLKWNWNVLPVLSALRVKFAVDILDFSRVAVRLIATANGKDLSGMCHVE